MEEKTKVQRMKKIGISLGNSYSAKTPDMVRLVSELGFSAVTPSMPLEKNDFDIEGIAEAAKESGLSLAGLHAPFLHAAALWHDAADAGERGKNEIIEGIGICKKYEIKTLVVHAYIGFSPSEGPTELGFSRMDEVVKDAERSGVLLALENTEGENYLDALLSRYKGCASVGFCYDSGHEQCYNGGGGLLEKYGERLLFTHLNDNLGVSASDGRISPMDDLHLLPFDGIIDWEKTAEKLVRSRATDVLNFELNIRSKPGRHENDVYEKMSYKEYFSEVIKRAQKISALMERLEGKN